MISNFRTSILHIEPTTACNAACPQCAREVDSTFDKKVSVHLSIPQILEVFDDKKISQLSKMFMCGNYGDPAAGIYTLDIYNYFKKVNPAISLGMNTNGGLRNEEWWRELASILTLPTDYVVFSIDGLRDTNHIYRVNTDWDKIMRNASSFINNGGNAHWDMLIFKHNEHQIDDAIKLAKSIGFKWFRAKVSKRFIEYPVSFLEAPTTFSNTSTSSNNINCQMLKESSMYMSAYGTLYPCCYLGSTSFTLDQFPNVQASWQSTSPNYTCLKTCASTSCGTNFENQWRLEIEL